MSERSAFGRGRNGYVLRIAPQERALVIRLLGELTELLSSPNDQPATARLFPVVHPDDPDQEAEYQRLMRDELVTSRVAAIDTVLEVLGRSGRKVTLDEAQLVAFMQSVNAVRLVLGTLLDVGEDDELSEDDGPERHLYGYLSWVLDASVRALSGDGGTR